VESDEERGNSGVGKGQSRKKHWGRREKQHGQGNRAWGGFAKGVGQKEPGGQKKKQKTKKSAARGGVNKGQLNKRDMKITLEGNNGGGENAG